MKRNLESRVEVLARVEKTERRALLRQCLDVQLQDRRSAWEMGSDGSYRQLRPGPEEDGRGAQQVLTDLATQRWQDHVRNSARDLFSRRTAITSWSRE